MPAVTRVGLDSHVGHASPTPNPFHQTASATGSGDVFTNGASTTRIGDTTSCGDPATGSGTVFVNGKEFIDKVMHWWSRFLGAVHLHLEMFLRC